MLLAHLLLIHERLDEYLNGRHPVPHILFGPAVADLAGACSIAERRPRLMTGELDADPGIIRDVRTGVRKGNRFARSITGTLVCYARPMFFPS